MNDIQMRNELLFIKREAKMTEKFKFKQKKNMLYN